MLTEFSDYWDSDRSISFPDTVKTFFGLFHDLNLKITSESQTFLGLAAGSGRAEILMAELLDLAGDVVLVDKISEKIVDFGGKYVESDLFAFLESSSEKYGAITLFGAEYIVADRKTSKRFWAAIDRVTTKGSFLFISDSYAPDIDTSRFRYHYSQFGYIIEKIAD